MSETVASGSYLVKPAKPAGTDLPWPGSAFLDRRYSALAPDLRMTSPHFVRSLFTYAANSATVPPRVS